MPAIVLIFEFVLHEFPASKVPAAELRLFKGRSMLNWVGQKLVLASCLGCLFWGQVSVRADQGDELLKVIEASRRKPNSDRPNVAHNGETHVIAIGVENYTQVPKLNFCIDDAQILVTAFQVVGKIDPANSLFLTDTKERPLQASSIQKQVDERLAKLNAEDNLVFMFSGHGFHDESGEMYLCPSDFNPEFAAKTGVSVVNLRDSLAQCRASTKFVFLDACYSGGFNSRLDGNQLANAFRTLKGTATITSSSNGQPSAESPSLKQGVFTYWLVKGLRGQANAVVDNHIDVAELYRFVKDQVPRTARAEGGLIQHPTWAFEHLAGIPNVIELKRPDRPSDLVKLLAMPLPPEPDTLETVLSTISQFPHASPRRGIGLTKWILKNAPAKSELAKNAQQHLDTLDSLLLQGKITLEDETEED